MSDMGQIGIEGVPEEVKAQQSTPQAPGWTAALQANQAPVQLSAPAPIADNPAMSVASVNQPATAAASAIPPTPSPSPAGSGTVSTAIRASDMTRPALLGAASSLAASSATSGNGGTPLPGLDSGTHVQLTPRKSLTVDDQRYSLARIFVITFAAGLLFLGLLVGAGIVNQIINGTPSGQTPFFSFNDLLQLLTAFGTVVGTPLGFVVGYYFKGQEIAASSNVTGTGNNPNQQ